MKLVKFALYLAILIALTKNGYSADPARKTLSDPRDGNADEDAADSLHVKPATWRASWYDVGSLHHPCVKGEPTPVVYQGNKMYMHYECKTHSELCSGPGYLRKRCEPSGYNYIPLLNKSVVSGCRCKAD